MSKTYSDPSIADSQSIAPPKTFDIDYTKFETDLAVKSYFSGVSLPDEEDAKVFRLISKIPDMEKFPNLFAWWWSLCTFSPATMASWGVKLAAPQNKKLYRGLSEDASVA